MRDKHTADLFEPPPPTPPTGAQLRDEGAESVLEHADDWKDQASAAIDWLAMHRPEGFTSEDVIERVGMPPNHPSAVGAAILAASRGKHPRIAWTGRVTAATRSSCHAALLKIWSRV